MKLRNYVKKLQTGTDMTDKDYKDMADIMLYLYKNNNKDRALVMFEVLWKEHEARVREGYG